MYISFVLDNKELRQGDKYFVPNCTLIKQENQIFLICKEIQNGAVAKSYMRKGFLNMRKSANISPYMRRPLVIYDSATAPF